MCGVPLLEKKRGDGLERRPPAGTAAQERCETADRLDDSRDGYVGHAAVRARAGADGLLTLLFSLLFAHSSGPVAFTLLAGRNRDGCPMVAVRWFWYSANSMKKIVFLLAGLFLTGLAGAASRVVQEATFTGFVADEACASDYARSSADHQACATGCLKRGERVALAMESGLHLLDLTAEAAADYLGMEVTVTGVLDAATNTITVSSIAPRTP